MKKGIAIILDIVKLLARFNVKPFLSDVDSAPADAADSNVVDEDDDDDAACDNFVTCPPLRVFSR